MMDVYESLYESRGVRLQQFSFRDIVARAPHNYSYIQMQHVHFCPLRDIEKCIAKMVMCEDCMLLLWI